MTAPKPKTITMEPIVLRRKEAAAALSISESMLDALVAREILPRPKKISSGCVGWLTEDLKTWSRALPESDLLPPVNAGYGRAGKPGQPNDQKAA